MNTLHDNQFNRFIPQEPSLQEAARIAIEDSLKVKRDERVLIVSNPCSDVSLISQAIFDAAIKVGARPVLIYQPVKTQMDFADPVVIEAFKARPDVFISMSAEKLGKDEAGITRPYQYGTTQYDHIFHLQLYGEKTCRAFWSPSTNLESFIRTVPIDYTLLAQRCNAIKNILDRAAAVRVTAPGGTNVYIGLKGRLAKSDDGDFSCPGTGGNLPAGETFISPENGTAQGIIAFDGSISLHDRDILINEPIRCTLEGGYITAIEGGEEARELLKTITMAEGQAAEYEKTGRLPAGSGAIYAKNARNIGELGIGLNPLARITGNMLEDEKAFRTCHFAVGHNYDEDAPALIHLDGLVKDPTIVAIFENGREQLIEEAGELRI
jgi:leucyl aminopeptidase (aminopeptidase T)